jgi:hypothetical protein
MAEPGAARRFVAASIAVLCLPAALGAQSAADLSARLAVDGDLADFTAAETVFRTPAVCAALIPPLTCAADEERAGDSSGGTERDVRQTFVTWDAADLYVGVEATLDGAALVVLLDVEPDGLVDLVSLPEWRRAVRCGVEIQPDFLLACDDATRTVELWRVVGTAAIERVESSAFRAARRFGGAARGLEVAIPWSVLFPGAPPALDPEPGAPATPVFVLPAAASRSGLRMAALVVDARDGFGALDVAPDPRGGVPLDPRDAVDVDRTVRVAWDERRTAGAPDFVDFGAAVQTQAAPRFVPEAPAAPVPLAIRGLQTFDGDQPTALLVADAGRTLGFRFAVGSPAPPEIFLTARILSLRGERVRDLYRDARRTAAGPTPFADAAQDVWDGRDAHGRPVPGGIYVLQLRAVLSPGDGATVLQHAVSVVR